MLQEVTTLSGLEVFRAKESKSHRPIAAASENTMSFAAACAGWAAPFEGTKSAARMQAMERKTERPMREENG